MTPGWSREIAQFILLLVVAVVLGGVLGHTTVWLVLALAVELGWQAANLYRLDRWLRRERRWNTPSAGGVWGGLYNQLYRMRRHERERKRLLTRLLREIRDSTAAMPDGLVIFNQVGEIRWLNDNAGRLLGLRVPQDMGQRIVNLVRQPEFLRYLHARRYDEPLTMRAPFSGDAQLTVRIISYGRDQRLLIVRDTTRLHRLEQTRREFVANASHELRTPLTVLRGYLDMLIGDADLQGKWGTQLEEMHRQAARMSDIVHDLLELSRLETESHEAPYVPVDVSGMLERLRQEALALGHGPREVQVEADTGLRLLGAEKELYSAFSNLVINAMKYTPAEGSVSLRWQREGDSARFSVVDTGIGIPAEHIPRLSERFYRVDRSRSRDSGGTGLGLAIVKHVLQHHGATLKISSRPGQGSSFSCVFPGERMRAVVPEDAQHTVT